MANKCLIISHCLIIVKAMDESERIANCLCGDNVFDIKGVEDLEYPVELNAFILVLKNWKKYKVTVVE